MSREPGPLPPGIALTLAPPESAAAMLSPEALSFVARVARTFSPRLQQLLERRVGAQAQRDGGVPLDFLTETQSIRDGDWKIAPLPEDLLRRQVEITGPVERKMIINALNSGADVFMADFEDSSAPSFANMVQGQQNLFDAIRRTITFVDTARDKSYALGENPAVLVVRPRGLHLVEGHVLIDQRPVPAALFDAALYFFHNAAELLDRNTGPYFYLPKLESHHEARLWNDVFSFMEDELGLPYGVCKATVLIETLPAAFEMDEILYELRDHAAGLNCGRWDYIFSFIKNHRNDANAILPDRGDIGMTQHCMRSYSLLVIQTCHKRGAFAMGGMAAQIPIKGDEEKNAVALAKVRADKQREASDGHDGTWVAHPGLVSIARDAFTPALAGLDNQLDVMREDVVVTAEDLLTIPVGNRTVSGLRENLRIGVQYLASWVSGNGCVPINDLMEDAATAEISRTQVWQWLKHGAALETGTGETQVTTEALVRDTLTEEMDALKAEVGADAFSSGRFQAAQALMLDLVTREQCPDFLTTVAYGLLTLEPE